MMYGKLSMGLAALVIGLSLHAAEPQVLLSVNNINTNAGLRSATPQAKLPDPQAVILAFTKAWNAHDAKAMAALWADDGDLIDPWGKWAQSRKAVERAFTDDQSGRFKNSTMNLRIEGVKFLGPIAIVDVSARLAGATDPEGKPAEPLEHHVTWVMQKQGDGNWKVVAARPYMLLNARK